LDLSEGQLHPLSGLLSGPAGLRRRIAPLLPAGMAARYFGALQYFDRIVPSDSKKNQNRRPGARLGGSPRRVNSPDNRPPDPRRKAPDRIGPGPIFGRSALMKQS